MNNQYLGVLGLMPGASKSEIKTAYRQLSKVYHPDVSKDDNAREKFIEINEAYKFLTAVGPRPATIESNAPAYDYNAQDHHYDEWRRRAKQFAKRRAKDALRRQQVLIKSLLSGFEIVLLLMVVFNIFLIIDSHLPLVAVNDDDNLGQTIFKSSSSYYDIVEVNGYTIQLKRGAMDDIKSAEYRSAVVFATQWLNRPLFLDLNIHGVQYRFEQYAGIYGFFSFLIKVILLIALIYKVAVRSLDTQLGLAIFLLFLSSFQVLVFLSF